MYASPWTLGAPWLFMAPQNPRGGRMEPSGAVMIPWVVVVVLVL
jgi:hypothetical protein